jgi:hypothetical protein
MSLIKKASFLRLAKPEKHEFTYVNDYFEGKRKEKNGVFLQRLINEGVQKVIVQHSCHIKILL